MFVLADDALMLLEQAASELLPSKDEKGPQNHLKDGSAEEDFSKKSSDHNERLLTYFGRRMIETFVLARIFSNKIEIAYQYDVALKLQEELIREEEKAGAAKSEQKAMHAVSAKEKKSRKKLGINNKEMVARARIKLEVKRVLRWYKTSNLVRMPWMKKPGLKRVKSLKVHLIFPVQRMMQPTCMMLIPMPWILKHQIFIFL
ncbi:hypothetical protein Droror1_Dr00003536 [Drosera rotundifolia]